MQAQRYRHRFRSRSRRRWSTAPRARARVHWIPVVLDSGESLADVPAGSADRPGREFLQSGKTQGEIAARINCRWFPGIRQDWRIVWEGVFNIAGWDLDRTARRASTAFSAPQKVNDGQ